MLYNLKTKHVIIEVIKLYMPTIKQSLTKLFNQIIFLQLRSLPLLQKFFLHLTIFRLPCPNTKIVQRFSDNLIFFSHIKPGPATPRPRGSSRMKAGTQPSPTIIQRYLKDTTGCSRSFRQADLTYRFICLQSDNDTTSVASSADGVSSPNNHLDSIMDHPFADFDSFQSYRNLSELSQEILVFLMTNILINHRYINIVI